MSAVLPSDETAKHVHLVFCFYLLKVLNRMDKKGCIRSSAVEQVEIAACLNNSTEEADNAVNWCIENEWVESWTDDFGRLFLAITGRGKARLSRMPY